MSLILSILNSPVVLILALAVVIFFTGQSIYQNITGSRKRADLIRKYEDAQKKVEEAETVLKNYVDRISKIGKRRSG